MPEREGMHDRPLLDAIDERDAIDRTRTALARQRVQAMEAALDAIGFGCDTLTGSLARLLALVADGWQPVCWSWDRLIDDRKLNWGTRRTRGRRRAADARKNRIDSLRRSLRELAEFGLVEWSTEAAARRRGCRSETRPVVRLCREVILAEAAGTPVVMAPKTPAELSPPAAEALATKPATTAATKPATKPATTAATTERQTARALYSPLNPKEPNGPFKTETKGRRDQGSNEESGQPRRLTPAEVAPTAARLFAALGYSGDEGRTLWRVAAAHVAGSITEAEIAAACRGTRSKPRRDAVAAFWAFLETECGKAGATLRERLAAAYIVGGIPTTRPRLAERDAATIATPKPAPRPAHQCNYAATLAARESVIDRLAALASGGINQGDFEQ